MAVAGMSMTSESLSLYDELVEMDPYQLEQVSRASDARAFEWATRRGNDAPRSQQPYREPLSEDRQILNEVMSDRPTQPQPVFGRRGGNDR
jgi:hypothetical protein